MGRSTDGVDENGLLPTRGARIPGLGPGTPGGPGRGPGMAGGAPGGGADWAGGCPGAGPGAGGAGRRGAGVGAWGVAGGAGAAATAPLSLVAGAPAASPGPAALGIALSSAFSRPWPARGGGFVGDLGRSPVRSRFAAAERFAQPAGDGSLYGRRCGLNEFALFIQPGENFLAGNTEFLG